MAAGQASTQQQRMIEKTCVMLEMQDEMNRHVDADWRRHGRAWYRAIWIECAELMDHYGGWKWWKHSTPDIPQAVLEIVDIWHFGLSMRIEAEPDRRRAALQLVAEWEQAQPATDFLAEVERLATAALDEHRFAVDAVHNLLAVCERDFDHLYAAYVAKNVLNVFRQDKGYKRGTYIKTWHGREDNEVLAELIDALDHDRSDFRVAIYDALELRYAEVNVLS